MLNVIDSPKTGLALLLTDKDFDLLRMLEKRDTIRDMAFFGGRVKIKEDGIVKHITKVKDGKYLAYFPYLSILLKGKKNK